MPDSKDESTSSMTKDESMGNIPKDDAMCCMDKGDVVAKDDAIAKDDAMGAMPKGDAMAKDDALSGMNKKNATGKDTAAGKDDAMANMPNGDATLVDNATLIDDAMGGMNKKDATGKDTAASKDESMGSLPKGDATLVDNATLIDDAMGGMPSGKVDATGGISNRADGAMGFPDDDPMDGSYKLIKTIIIEDDLDEAEEEKDADDVAIFYFNVPLSLVSSDDMRVWLHCKDRSAAPDTEIVMMPVTDNRAVWTCQIRSSEIRDALRTNGTFFCRYVIENVAQIKKVLSEKSYRVIRAWSHKYCHLAFHEWRNATGRTEQVDNCEAFGNFLEFHIERLVGRRQPGWSLHDLVVALKPIVHSISEFREGAMSTLCKIHAGIHDTDCGAHNMMARVACAVVGLYEIRKQRVPSDATSELVTTCAWIVDHFSALSSTENDCDPRILARGFRYVCWVVYTRLFRFSWLSHLDILRRSGPLFHALPTVPEKESVDAMQSFLDICRVLINEAVFCVPAVDECEEDMATQVGAVRSIAIAFQYAPFVRSIVDVHRLHPELRAQAMEVIRSSILKRLQTMNLATQLADVKLLRNEVPSIGPDKIARALLRNELAANRAISPETTVQLLQDLLYGVDQCDEQLVNAVKHWLRRRFAAPPKCDTTRDDSNNTRGGITAQGPVLGSGTTTGSGATVSGSRTVVTQACEQLVAAGAIWKGILLLPVLQKEPCAEHIATICSELTTSYIFREAAPLTAVEAILRWSSLDEEAENCHSNLVALTQHLREFCEKLVEQSAAGNAMAFVDVVLRCDRLGAAHLHILQIVAREMGVNSDQSPHVDRVLEFVQTWSTLIRRFDPDFPSQHPFGILLVNVKAVIVELIERVCCATGALADLKKVILYFPSLEQLVPQHWICKTMDDGARDWTRTLRQRKAEWEAFESKMTAVNCYVALYCKSEKIEADIIEHEITRYRAQYDYLTLADVRDAFEKVEGNQWWQFFYDVRGSKWFISMWKVGAALLRTVLHDIQYVHDDRATYTNFPCARCDHTHFGTLSDLYQHVTHAHHVDAAQPGSHTALLDDIIPHDIAAGILVPDIIRKWAHWYRALDDGSARVRDVSEVFEHTSATIELPLLHKSCRHLKNEGLDLTRAQWTIDRVLTRIQKARDVEQLKLFLPNLVKFRAMMPAALFASRDDPFVAPIRRATASASEQNLQLKDLEVVCANLDQVFVAIPFIKQLSFVQRQYLSLLSSGPSALMEWLVKKVSTEDFNKMISLVRPCTDDPCLLQALATLVQLRTTLSKLLYKEDHSRTVRMYANLKEFTESFSTKMDALTALDVSNLSTVQRSFDMLMKLVERNTQNVAMKAVYDLRDIMQRGKYTLKVGVMDNEQLTVSKSDSTTVLNYGQLSDLRKQLLMTEVPEELEDAGRLKRWTEQFMMQIELLAKIVELLHKLNVAGHFDYFTGKQFEFYPQRLQRAELTQLIANCKRDRGLWKAAIVSARNEFYFLNYFIVAEIRFLAVALRKILKMVRENVEEDTCAADIFLTICPLLLVVGSITLESLIDALMGTANLWDAELGGATIDTLRALGATLHRIYGHQAPVVRPLLADNSLSDQKNLFFQKSGSDGVFVCSVDGDMVDFVFSIFARRERLPEAEEVLYCSRDTTVEEVVLLVRRYIGANEYGRGERVYVCANIELLAYGTQCAVVEYLRQLLDGVPSLASVATLVFASKCNNQFILSALEQKTIAISTLPKLFLQQCVANVSTQGGALKDHSLLAVSSTINGAGKSHFILKRAHRIQQSSPDTCIYRRILVREHSTAASLIRDLNDGVSASGPNKKTFFHLDLAHSLPDNIHALLFQVLIVGTLCDVGGGMVGQCFHKRPGDHFVLEIPSLVVVADGMQNGVTGILSLASLLPSQKVTVEASSLDFTTPKAIDGVVVCPPNDRLLVTCKYLRSMRSGVFKPTTANFDIAWSSKKGAISTKKCFDLLLAHTAKGEEPNFLIFINFTNFMGAQFERVESYPLLRMRTLCDLGDQWPEFKQVFCDLLLRTSADFSLRQVPRHVSSTNENAAARQAQIARFKSMQLWEHSPHPISVFCTDERSCGADLSWLDVSGVEIVSLDPRLLRKCMSAGLRETLEHNNIRLEKNWKNVQHDEAVALIRQVEGVTWSGPVRGSNHFALTIDGLLKSLSIQLRLKYGLPVLLMGETGCGKTALIKFVCDALRFPLRTMDVHGGICDVDIIHFVESCARVADGMSDGGCVVCFLDEINAANCMALFKAIICDRFIPSRKLPSNLRIVAACNPYRLRHNVEDEEAALVYQFARSTYADPLAKLVYRVHALPESLIDCVQDFGALSEQTEKLYVHSILSRELPKLSFVTKKVTIVWRVLSLGKWINKQFDLDYKGFIGAFQEVICATHCFLREINNGERSVVSLRDVDRACTVFKWFLRYYTQLKGDKIEHSHNGDAPRPLGGMEITKAMCPHLRSAIILSLAYTYHARLSRDHRRLFRERICTVWSELSKMDNRLEWLSIACPVEFERVIVQTQTEFVSEMNLGEGVALNEALRENLFMLLVSVMNRIPIFLIGKPGCSKSLAVELLQSNFNGEVSARPFLKLFPAVEVFPFQCTPLTQAEGITSAFARARKYSENNNALVLVLLDEVGLADLSPHMPLKVLHKELDNLQGVACVGISNWALDAAKMNRAVHLYRSPPTVEDLSRTAEGMVNSAHLRGYLAALAEAFFEVYHSQKRGDFWGLREFYSTVRVINTALHQQMVVAPTLEPEILMAAVLRNYGGRPDDERERVIGTFFSYCGLDSSAIRRDDPVSLIKQNLREPDARHLMLLTHHNAALPLLFDHRIVNYGTTEVMFGSTFRADNTDLFVTTNLMRIKQLMREPVTLILVNCDALYESLYDLLNQHYLEYSGQRYVRLAHGAHSQLCPIHHLFRVIVIVSTMHAYTNLAPPLLNRFEKQRFYRTHLMSADHKRVLARLEEFVHSVRSDVGGQSAFACDHPELLSSLVMAEPPGLQWFERCVQQLCCILRPEAVSLLRATQETSCASTFERFGVDVLATYDTHTTHTLPVTFIMEELLPKNDVTELGNNSTATADRIVKEENHFDNGQEDYEIPFDAKECTEADDASPSRAKRARLDDARSQVEARVTHVAPKRMLSDENVKDEQNTPKRHRVESTQKGQCVHDAQASAISPKRTRAIIVLMDSDDESDYGAHADKSCDAVSSLQQFGKTRLDALGAQILVMTHTPMGGAFLESLSTSVGDRCDLSSILLHELSTMTDFEKRLTNFYDGKRCGRPKILVLQTDLRIATIEQIEHCRFLCDKIRQRKIDETSEDKYHPHHIFFCIHLSRGAEAHHFPLDYDNRWKLLFLDTMESAPAGLPTLTDMINASIAQVLRLPSVNFAKVLQMVVRHSLARLAYSARRTLDDATRQIHALLDLMQNQVEFVDLLLQHVCDMLDASESTSCETWYLEIARKPYTVTLAGTFHAALQKRLLEAVSAALSALLTQLDRNDNLKLVDQPGSRHLWYQIATSVLAQPYVMFLGKAAIDASARSQLSSFKFDVVCDAGSRSVAGFRSQFPFSFFIAKKIEGLRELSQGDLASLERQWTMTGLNITPHRTEEEIAHYVTDFLSMYLPHGMPLHVDVKHVWTLMQHAVEQRHRTSLLGVHAAYWAIGGRLRIYFSLMDLAHLGVSVLEKINALNGQYDMYILGHCSRGLISELRTEGFSDNWFVRSRKALLHVYDLFLHAEGVGGASSNNQYNIDAQRDNKKRQQCDSVVRLDLLVRVAELCKDASIERHLPNDMFSFDADAIPRDFPKRFKVLESWMHVLLELPSRSNKNVCVKIAQELPKDGYFKVARLSVMRALMVHPLGYAALEEVIDRGSLIYILAVTVFEENQAQCQPPCKRTYSTVSAAYERAVLNINLRRYADTYQNAPAALFTDESSRLLVLKRWLHFHGQAGLRQIFRDHKLDWLRASMEFVSAALGGSQMTWDALKDNPKYITARRKLRDICAGNCIQDGFGDTLRANLVHASALFTELHLPRANGIVLPCSDTFYRRYLNADDHHTRILALAAGLGGWKLKNRASADRIMMTRCLVHLLSIALHGVGVLSVFRQLLLEPRALIRWWLPAMQDDVRRMLGGQFNNAWYTCKNGHPYFIGECGAPMQRGVCPECNEPIGGTHHSLLKSNKGMARTAITAPQGYSLELEDATDKWLNIRNLPDVCARALRWCLHGLMFVGSQAGIDYSCIRNNALSATWTTQLQRQTFFEKQLVHDWTILKEHLHNGENVALYLHHAFHRLVEGSKGMPANAPKLSSEKARGDWEVSIFRMGLNVLTGTVVTADELRTKYQMDGSATAVLADIAAELPAEDDFAFRDGTTAALAPLEDLKNVDLQAHELLGRVIAQYPQPLMALEYLRDCIHWVTFVHATYSMKIDRERARLMTIRDALNDAGERERKAFQGFQEAWRLAWPSVTHYDCLEVPSGYKEVVDMQDTRPLSFCMASEKDESICCLAFLQLLVNQHNALLEGVATHNTEEVPSHMLVASHVIDLRSVRLEDLLAKRCLTYDRGARKYDLNHATNTLRHALSVKPRIRLVLPEFVFLKEGAAFRLHQIPQKDLPLSIQHILTQALAHNASVASSCLDLVDMAMHFLRAQTEVQLDDGNTVAKMSLKDYLSSVLLVAHTNDCPITASEHIRLEHLEHLRTFLSDACNGRQETLVRPKYKTPLPETVMAALEDALTRVDASMLSGCVSDLMKEHLGEDSLNANESLKVVLEMFRADLSEQAWWQYFPKELLVAHTAALSERLGANRA